MQGLERLLKYLQVKNTRRKGIWRYGGTANKYEKPLEATGVRSGVKGFTFVTSSHILYYTVFYKIVCLCCININTGNNIHLSVLIVTTNRI